MRLRSLSEAYLHTHLVWQVADLRLVGQVHLLEAHRRDNEDARGQAFYAGVSRPRELSHDVQLYRAYLREEQRLRDEGADRRREPKNGATEQKKIQCPKPR